MRTPKHEELLRDAGLRVTPGRIALLHTLSQESKPISVDALAKLLKGSINQVTLYRALEALEKAGIVMRSSLGHEHAHYELVSGRPHHHHAICTSCGHIEDIEIPHGPNPEKDAQKRTKHFSSIDKYSLEFFGTCTSCA